MYIEPLSGTICTPWKGLVLTDLVKESGKSLGQSPTLPHCYQMLPCDSLEITFSSGWVSAGSHCYSGFCSRSSSVFQVDDLQTRIIYPLPSLLSWLLCQCNPSPFLALHICHLFKRTKPYLTNDLGSYGRMLAKGRNRRAQ